MTRLYSALAGTMLALFIAGCQSPTSEISTLSTIEEAVSERSSAIVGDFVVVDARRASHVASPYNPELDVPIGGVVTFSENGSAISGLGCENWVLKPAEHSSIPVSEDPVLSDLIFGIMPAEAENGKSGRLRGFNVTCDNRHFTQILQIDERVFVATWANSTLNLILEKPMTERQVTDLQAQLKSMKFYDDASSGIFDEQTVDAVRAYMDYRLDLDALTPIPARPAMTKSLLVELGVLEE